MSDGGGVLEPARFCAALLRALDASEGRRKRRRRDTSPDAAGLRLKRELLERAVAEQPPPEQFEAWLLQQVLAAPAPGPMRAVCAEILDEYQVAGYDDDFARWLISGAASADAGDTPALKRRDERQPPSG